MTKRILLGAFGFLLATAAAELILHWLPVATGYDLGPVNDGNPIPRGSPHYHYTSSKDWSFHLVNSGSLNNYGFRSSRDYVRDPSALVVIGNSYVQADAIPPSAAMTERLGRLLHRPAYAVGVDGFALVDYLVAANWAVSEFGTQTLVILLTNGDVNHSCVARVGQHYLLRSGAGFTIALLPRPQPSAAKRMLNDSRLFRYLFANLQLAGNWGKGWRREDDPAAAPKGSGPTPPKPGLGCTDAAYAEAATQFLLQSFHGIETARNARIVFALAPGYRREQNVEAGGVRDVDLFARRAESDGFTVIRLDAAFAAALSAGLRVDYLPIDGHWNQVANELAAQVLAQGL
jgi:hypothetical protein